MDYIGDQFSSGGTSDNHPKLKPVELKKCICSTKMMNVPKFKHYIRDPRIAHFNHHILQNRKWKKTKFIVVHFVDSVPYWHHLISFCVRSIRVYLKHNRNERFRKAYRSSEECLCPFCYWGPQLEVMLCLRFSFIWSTWEIAILCDFIWLYKFTT